MGISALTLVPGLSGGSETYLRQLLAALAAVGELDYRAYFPGLADPGASGILANVSSRYHGARDTPRRLLAMGWATLSPGAIRRELAWDSLAAVHFPLTVMLPPPAGVPAAVTVHDLQHETFPEFFSAPERAYRRVVYGRSIRSSRLVIAISEHVRKAVLDRYRLAPENVRTIHHGIDHRLFRPGSVEREDFLLYPANNWPHKNHDRLLEAFALLRRSHPGLRLTLTGNGHERRRLPAGVELLGRVPFAELPGLYRRAAALVFPSLFEGFGQPPLEAMACGCPVAASRATSLPEVCGEAAEYFDPMAPEDIAAAVERVLSEPDRYRAAGIAQAAGFTWERSAKAHEAVYRELLA